MSIILVGGHDRMSGQYKLIASKYGVKMKIYNKLPPRFSKSIGSPDVIVLFTDTVSHKMANIASKEARKKSIPVELCHNSSQNTFESKIKKLKAIV